MKKLRCNVFRGISLSLALLLLLGVCFLPASAQTPDASREVTLLFTHDLHSRFLPQSTADGGQSGGYARLKTAIDREKAAHPDALVLDGGDFSIGSLIQTLYTTQAPELRTMGALGYDAGTIGNHEFDHTGTGFAQMLRAAVDSGEPLPALVEANYRPAEENPDAAEIRQAMDDYGVTETLLLERGGITYGIFGLMGVDSDECAPTSGFTREDAAAAAKRCVAELQTQGAQVIVCLSHSGTGDSLEVSEDEELAKAVDGIDVILSGHTHTTLDQPLTVNGTYIVSAGPYCRNLGSLTLAWDDDGRAQLKDYRLIPIDETLPADSEIAALVEQWKAMVGEGYLSRWDLTYDQVLTSAAFDLPTPVSGVQEGNALGELVADAFLWATEHLEADAPEETTVSVTADGVLRASLPAGDLTVSQAFDVLSMGVGADGSSGFPLVAVYLTGKELKAAAEVDASVTPIMPAAQLYVGGMRYSFNAHRMFFDRVMTAELCQPPFRQEAQSQGVTQLEDDALYRVITGMYSAQMLSTVKSKSMGLLSLEPKRQDGTPVTDFNDCILYDDHGNEIKEWYALAAYLNSFGEDGVPEHYAHPDGRKQVSSSWNPVQLLRSPGWITITALLVLLLAVFLVVLGVRRIVRCVRARSKKRNS